MNGMDSGALTLLDVLDAFEEIKVAVAYRYKGSEIKEFPAEPWVLSACEPVYRTLKGWRADTTDCREIDDLPAEAIAYLRAIEDLIECDLDLVSVGPTPECSMIRGVSKLSAWLEGE